MNDAVNPRRSFLRNLALVITTAFMTRTQSTPIFYVAGVRYHSPRRPPQNGEDVLVIEESFGGTACFAIETCRGERIGYVPRNWIDAIERSGRRAGRVLYANPYALPWRRYRIELT
jgi:hypothetical protein